MNKTLPQGLLEFADFILYSQYILSPINRKIITLCLSADFVINCCILCVSHVRLIASNIEILKAENGFRGKQVDKMTRMTEQKY